MAKLVWRVKLIAELGLGIVSETEVARIEHDDFAVACGHHAAVQHAELALDATARPALAQSRVHSSSAARTD